SRPFEAIGSIEPNGRFAKSGAPFQKKRWISRGPVEENRASVNEGLVTLADSSFVHLVGHLGPFSAHADEDDPQSRSGERKDEGKHLVWKAHSRRKRRCEKTELFLCASGFFSFVSLSFCENMGILDASFSSPSVSENDVLTSRELTSRLLFPVS